MCALQTVGRLPPHPATTAPTPARLDGHTVLATREASVPLRVAFLAPARGLLPSVTSFSALSKSRRCHVALGIHVRPEFSTQIQHTFPGLNSNHQGKQPSVKSGPSKLWPVGHTAPTSVQHARWDLLGSVSFFTMSAEPPCYDSVVAAFPEIISLFLHNLEGSSITTV